MFIYNDISINSAFRGDKDSELLIIRGYKVGDIIKRDGSFIERISAIDHSKITTEKKNIEGLTYQNVYEFHELEPLVINPPGTSLHEYYYCTIFINDYKLIQGHEVFNPGDKCIATFIDKNIFKEPCIYLGCDNDTTYHRLYVHFEVIRSNEHITLYYDSFERDVSGQIKEDKNVYLSRKE